MDITFGFPCSFFIMVSSRICTSPCDDIADCFMELLWVAVDFSDMFFLALLPNIINFVVYAKV